MSDPRCYYCPQPAVALCDYVTRQRGYFITTCDRPICREHRRVAGHICDRSRRTTNNNSDTIDHCREHPP